MRRLLALTLLLLGLVLDAPVAGADPACTNVPADRRMSDAGIGLTQSLGLASGRYALPSRTKPTQLVVMMHGYGNDSCSWRNHLRQAAARGAVAIAMDYTKQDPKTNRGWYVREGAEDSIAAAKYFMHRFPTLSQVYLMGISMGGNAAGMALISANAKRPDGKPLFDHWIAVEGVHNLAQEYMLFRAASADFEEDVRREAGGTFEEVPDRYLALTNVAHAQEMSYLKSAVLVHGVDDLLVANPQSRQMADELRAVGVPTELYTVLGRGDGEQGTTISGLAAQPVFDAAGLGAYSSPLAGHGWEGSDTQLVIRLGFEQLWKVMAGKEVGPYREVVVHGEGLAVPVP